MLDAPEKHGHHEEGRLHVDNPPVGEYELLLANESQSLFKWKQKQWEEWLGLLQLRLLQLHHNPQLHHVLFALKTEALHSIEGYQRVGDLIATSHPIAGENPVLTAELASKIAEKEWLYKAHVGKHGYVYMPSAPTGEREIWYVPTTEHAGIEQIGRSERDELAYCLEKLVGGLHDEYPKDNFSIQIFTQIAGIAGDHVWWLRISHDAHHSGAVASHGYPEPLLRRLKLFFA